MKVFFLQIFGLMLLIIGALFFTVNWNSLDRFPFFNKQITTRVAVAPGKIRIVDGKTQEVKALLNIELAETKEKRALGLGGRDSLATDGGMLFVFDKKSIYKFWMKGMKIPLDFVWIDGDVVIDLLSNVAPPIAGQTDDTLPLVAPVALVDKVLEVNAGFVVKNRLAVGDRIQTVGGQ